MNRSNIVRCGTVMDSQQRTPINRPAAIMRRRRRVPAAFAAVAASLLLGACSTFTTGMGGGDLMQAGKATEPVLMSWTSDNGGLNGTMVATLPDRTYKGPFFEITQLTRKETLAPLWDGWGPGWYDWPYRGYPPYPPDDMTQFVTHYSGKVVANLRAPDGSRIRCRLHLVQPARGMAGGGEGRCQILGDGTIQARF